LKEAHSTHIHPFKEKNGTIGQWYTLNFEEMDNDGDMIENIYPSRILVFISINNEWEAVIQCSLKPLCWDDVEKTFIQEIQLGTGYDVAFVTVPIN
jgi:hypothetical protein